MHVHRSLRRAAVGVAAATVVLIPAASAEAHVRVFPDSTSSGGFAKLTFRVPNESDTAGTTSVAVTLPADKPFAFVSVQPVPGWTATVAKAKLPKPIDLEGTTITEAASTVTWTAQAGTQVAPGQFQEFAISAGPLPAPGELLLPAKQTYSDGKVVDWNQPETGSEEPEHPAPAFEVTAAAAEGGDDATAEQASTTTTAATTADAADDGAGAWPWVSGAALLVAIAALAVAVLGRRRPGASA